ncbi:type VI secretion system baseplate subunit TssK, partial [Xenorhabdus bovienii]|uniref:type VI secretion system baseplate subunit TssK n=1 Tax=Xenorhabdus bovienii TaxID=40576 RepID=UPI0023B214AC
NCHSHQKIIGFIADLQGLLEQRRKMINHHLLQPGQRNDSEVMDFLLLSLLNRYSGQINHIQNVRLLHPERLFSEWLQFSAELA